MVVSVANGLGSPLELAVLLLAAAALSYAATFVRRYYAGRVSLDVQYDLRTDLFTAMSRLDVRRPSPPGLARSAPAGLTISPARP